jgi:hypothetical protein
MTRMWGVDPRLLCDQHLLGEHVEMHMFLGGIRKGHSVRGYTDNGIVDPHRVFARHEALARELERRGMNHRSPMVLNPEDESAIASLPVATIDAEGNLVELARRCERCRERQNRPAEAGGPGRSLVGACHRACPSCG